MILFINGEDCPVKSKKPKKPLPPTLRYRLVELALSEVLRHGIKLIAGVGLALILQHIGAPAPGPDLLLV